MTRFDRLVVVLGVSLLSVIGGAIGVTSPPPAALPGPPPTAPPPLPTAAPPHLVRMGLVGAVTTLDPLYATTPTERDVSALLSCGLTRLGPGDEIVPDAASGWEIADEGRSYTFHLRRDAQWHDGQPVTADDVVFTLLSIRDRAYEGRFRGRWDGVFVERLDRWTVRFRLATPLGGFLPLTTQPLVPEHVLGPLSPAERRTHADAWQTIGCGPFRVGTTRTEGFDLVSAPTGARTAAAAPPWDPLGPVPEPTPAPADPRRPAIDGFRCTTFPDESALERAFSDGALDTVAGLSTAAMERLGALPGVRTIRYPTSRVTALLPNLRFERATLQDRDVRRALLLALDRPAIVTGVLDGGASLATSLIPPASSLFDPDAAPDIPYDPDAAGANLVAAGWSPGPNGWVEPGSDTPRPLELVTVDSPDRPELRRLAERIAAGWQAIGLKVRVAALPAGEAIARIRSGLFDVALLDLDLGLDPDLSPLLSSAQAQAGGTNLTGYQSAQTNALLTAASRYADPATRRERFAALQRRLGEELPILPLAFAEQPFLVRDTLTGPASRLVRDESDRFWDVLTWRLVRPG